MKIFAAKVFYPFICIYMHIPVVYRFPLCFRSVQLGIAAKLEVWLMGNKNYAERDCSLPWDDFVRVAVQRDAPGTQVPSKCLKLTLLRKFATTQVHQSSPGYSRLVCPLSTLEGNMSDGNKTTGRNVLLPADNNRVTLLPTGISHISQDVCYEQLISLEESK